MSTTNNRDTLDWQLLQTPEVARQLRRMAVDEDTSIQNLLAESLNLLFHSR